MTKAASLDKAATLLWHTTAFLGGRTPAVAEAVKATAVQQSVTFMAAAFSSLRGTRPWCGHPLYLDSAI